MDNNNVFLTLNKVINDKMYKVDTTISKEMLTIAQDPKGIVQALAGNAWNKLISDLGTLYE